MWLGLLGSGPGAVGSRALATVVRVSLVGVSSSVLARVLAVLSDCILVFPPSHPVSARGQWFSAAESTVRVLCKGASLVASFLWASGFLTAP